MSDNLAEYANPLLYDQENQDFEPEGSFYLSIVKETGGPVLELGCGTGRMTIPIAQAGWEIAGLDIVPGMIERAKQKAGDLPMTWLLADARDFHLGRQFRMIFENGSVFMHMLERADQRAYLACVREHLALGGRFVMSLFFPHPSRLQSDPEEKDWFTYQDEHGRTVRVTGTDLYDELRQVKTETAYRHVQNPDGSETRYAAPLSLRYTFPQEMEALLEQAGLRVVERFGGADRSPLSNQSDFLVYICE